MKIIRYFLCAFLLTITLTFSCDSFQLYIYGFQGPYKTSFYTQPGIPREKMLADIMEASTQFDVGVVFFKSTIKSNWSTENILFCSSNMKQYFEDHYHMKEGVHKSVFSGESYVTYKDFFEISEEDLQQYPEAYFLIGTEQQVMDFKASLVDLYAGSLPYLDGSNSLKDSVISVLLLWGITIAIVLSTTYYNIIITKKEYFVKITLGESPLHMIMKNILSDLLVLGLVFVINLLVLKHICGAIFLLPYSIACFLVLCIANALLYCTLFRLDIKLYNSSIKSSKKLLLINYCIKFVLTFLVCVSLASNLFFLQRYLELEKQKHFYEQRKDYFYITLYQTNYKMDYLSNIEDKFYREFYQKFNIQVNDLCFDSYETLNTIVFANSNMESYVLENIVLEESNNLKELLKQYDAFIFLPKNIPLSEAYLDDLSSDIAFYNLRENSKILKLHYTAPIKWIIYDGQLGYITVEDPIIAYSTKKQWEACEEEDFGATYSVRLNQAFTKIDETLLNQFCKENHCKYFSSNVYEDFTQILRNYKKGAALNLILLIIQVIIQFILIVTVIKLEFESNRLELVIKKILGYSKWERFRKLYLVTILSCLLCMVCILITQLVLNISYLTLAYIGSSVLVIIELCIISVLFVEQEKDNIQKTLKGGYL